MAFFFPNCRNPARPHSRIIAAFLAMLNGYHFSMEGIPKGGTFLSKMVYGVGLGVELPI